MVVSLKPAKNPLDRHPFVMKLSRSLRLGDDDLAAVAPLLARRVPVKKGKDVIVEGYEYGALYIVEAGLGIRYKLLHSGKRQILGLVLPGDIVGFPGCFFQRAVCSVTAQSQMSLHPISLGEFATLCQTRANIATALIWLLAEESAILGEHIVDTGRREPLERLAHFILEVHTRLQAVGQASADSFDMLLSQESIGDAVGLSAPHVNRMLAELRRGGLIGMNGHEIKILDRAALQVLAGFRPAYLTHRPIAGYGFDGGRALGDERYLEPARAVTSSAAHLAAVRTRVLGVQRPLRHRARDGAESSRARPLG